MISKHNTHHNLESHIHTRTVNHKNHTHAYIYMYLHSNSPLFLLLGRSISFRPNRNLDPFPLLAPWLDMSHISEKKSNRLDKKKKTLSLLATLLSSQIMNKTGTKRKQKKHYSSFQSSPSLPFCALSSRSQSSRMMPKRTKKEDTHNIYIYIIMTRKHGADLYMTARPKTIKDFNLFDEDRLL